MPFKGGVVGWKEHLKAFKADVRRYHELGDAGVLQIVGRQGVWASAVYRYGRWIYERPRGLSGVPLKGSYRVLNKAVEVAAGISLPASAQIDGGLYIGHFGQVIVHPETVAGKNLSIGQGVTIGEKGVGHGGVPVIGDDVYVGVGAKILGGLTVGDGVRVGANAVVVKDVGDEETVVGIPARPVQRKSRVKKGES